jgi:hypothetical protein
MMGLPMFVEAKNLRGSDEVCFSMEHVVRFGPYSFEGAHGTWVYLSDGSNFAINIKYSKFVDIIKHNLIHHLG